MGKPKKAAKMGHTKQQNRADGRIRVLVYRNGKLRFEWQEPGQ